MWHRSLIVAPSEIIDGKAIGSFRLVNATLTSSERLLIQLTGYERYNKPIYLREVKVYRCQLDLRSKTGFFDLNPIYPLRCLPSVEKQLIRKAIDRTLIRKVRNHPQTILTLREIQD